MLEALVIASILVATFVFAGWCVRLFITSEITASADVTSKMLWHVGRGCCWAGAVILAGGLFAAVVTTAVRVLGGGR